MNKEQEKFWKILSEPYEKSCENCMHMNHATGWCAAYSPELSKMYYEIDCTKQWSMTEDIIGTAWEWDEETY